jgi:hypothetical protein
VPRYLETDSLLMKAPFEFLLVRKVASASESSSKVVYRIRNIVTQYMYLSEIIGLYLTTKKKSS